MSKPKVLVTGASGFIGTHLCNRLHNLGFKVIGTVHETELTAVVDDEIWMDVSDPSSVYAGVLHIAPEIIIHLAAQPIVTRAEEVRLETIYTNTMGAAHIMEAAHAMNVSHVIVAGTDKEYGRQSVLPYTEDMALLGTHQIYEATKVAASNLVDAYCHSMKIPTTVTRFGNVYGPGDTHESRLVPHTIQSFIEGKAPVIRSNGQLVRDYVYVDDVVNAYVMLAGQRPVWNGHTNVYNFGTGRPVRVLDLVFAIRHFFPNSDVVPEILYSADGEIPQQYMDYSRAYHHLGWQPSTNLQDGLMKTIDWWKELYNAK